MSNCKKCEKEIAEGTLCEECKKGKQKKIISIIVLVILLLVLVAGVYAYFNVLQPNMKNGSNTMANIQNYGYAVENSNWIFYSIPDEKAEHMEIYKMKKDGSDNTLLCDREWNVSSLNLVGNWLYFIAYEETGEDEENITATAKIYKMKLDGTDIQEVTDDVTSSSYQITVIENEIYYINDEYQVCKIGINGGESTLVSEDKNGFIAIYDGWIYYPDYDTENYIMCKMKMDGSEKTQLTGEVMYDLNIVDDTIYFINSEGMFAKVPVNGGEVTKLSEVSIYNANVSGNYVYYMRYVNPEAEDYVVGLYRMKLDGTEEQQLKTFSNYSSFINVVGDWVMYSDNDDENGYMGMSKIDGSEDKTIYTFKFDSITDDTEENYEDETLITDENLEATEE